MKRAINFLKTAALTGAVGVISALPARATDPDLFTSATSTVTDNASKVVTFLGVAIAIPVSFAVYGLVKRVIRGAK